MPDWEVALDLDALGRAEGERWVFAGAEVLVPSHDRSLLRLSRGGADAVVVREFDLVARSSHSGPAALTRREHRGAGRARPGCDTFAGALTPPFLRGSIQPAWGQGAGWATATDTPCPRYSPDQPARGRLLR